MGNTEVFEVDESRWRVTAHNYVYGWKATSYFGSRRNAERFVEARKNSVGGRVGETWALERRFGGAWLRADGSES